MINILTLKDKNKMQINFLGKILKNGCTNLILSTVDYEDVLLISRSSIKDN